MAANERQIDGNHYQKYEGLQPWDMWTVWNLNPFQAAILKHIVRYRDKDGIMDLEKAMHYLEKLIEVEKAKQPPQIVLNIPGVPQDKRDN